jgi:hypothetical protein
VSGFAIDDRGAPRDSVRPAVTSPRIGGTSVSNGAVAAGSVAPVAPR